MSRQFQALKSEQDFARFRKSKSFYSSLFRVRVIAANQSVPRFGFIVPKKIFRRVVDRNKIKRRLKSIIQAHITDSRIVDVLIFPNPECIKKKYLELEQELIKVFRQARIWK